MTTLVWCSLGSSSPRAASPTGTHPNRLMPPATAAQLGLGLRASFGFRPWISDLAAAVDTYVNRLLAAGRKVALCDQQEPAHPGRLVKRSLIRILSPGTTLGANQLEAGRNHYLAAVSLDREVLRAAWLELSTGEFRIAADPHIENLLPVLAALDPREVLVMEGAPAAWRAAPHEQTAVHALAAFCAGRACAELPGYHFDTAAGARTVMDALGVLNLEGFGINHTHPRPRAGRGHPPLRHRKPLRQAGQPAHAAGVPQLARAAARSGHAAQPGDFPVRPRPARGLAARRDRPHRHRRGRPPARALARRPAARPRR